MKEKIIIASTLIGLLTAPTIGLAETWKDIHFGTDSRRGDLGSTAPTRVRLYCYTRNYGEGEKTQYGSLRIWGEIGGVSFDEYMDYEDDCPPSPNVGSGGPLSATFSLNGFTVTIRCPENSVTYDTGSGKGHFKSPGQLPENSTSTWQYAWIGIDEAFNCSEMGTNANGVTENFEFNVMNGSNVRGHTRE